MDSKQKILFLIPSLDGGGSEKVLTIILKYLSSDRYTLTLAVVCKPGIYFDLIPPGIKKVNLGVVRNRYALTAIYRLIKNERPDIVFTFNVNHTYLNVFVASLLLRSSIKYIVREATIVSEFLKTYPGRSRILKFFYMMAYARADVIICQSNFMQSDLVGNFRVSTARTQIIPNPLEVEEIRRASLEGEEAVEQSSPQLLAIGRLVHIKGFDFLLDAMRRLNSKARLVILGGETPEDPGCKDELLRLQSIYNLEKQVSFLPFDENPYAYIRDAHALVMTSRFEGFPNVAIEANALGKPVISFKSPGGILDIIQDGENGFLVEYGDTVALANAIERALTKKWDPERIARSVDKYNVTNVLPLYERLFEEVTRPPTHKQPSF